MHAVNTMVFEETAKGLDLTTEPTGQVLGVIINS